MKLKLKVNKHQFNNPGSTLGMGELLRGVANSDLFEVDFHDDYLGVMRGERATIIYYDDKKVYLDLWEYPNPSHNIKTYNANFDLIIKVQHQIFGIKHYDRYCNRKNILTTISSQEREAFLKKFVNWTFFPSALMSAVAGREDELISENYPIERDCFFCGKEWRCRWGMFKVLKAQGIECVSSDQSLRKGKIFDRKKYLHYMRSSKYGMVLRGRSTPLTDCKNRREIDYMMLKKPLVMDYEPNYYNPLVAGKHYILIDENTDVKLLDKMYNIDEIANNGYEWYKQNATTEAIPRTFLQIMQDKFGKE